MSDLRLVIFDVDGTLVDSQADIVASMRMAFDACDLPAPARDVILGSVGLSLPNTMQHLVPNGSAAQHQALVEGYKTAYMQRRSAAGSAQSSPLYPGARAALQTLHAIPEMLLGVATGKSRRGLDLLLDAHDLRRLFVTHHCADTHPSKPHPSMVLECLSDAGVAPHQAVMVGDTHFDMDMARAAGVGTIGVSWGYHPVEQLRAQCVIDDFAALPDAVATLLEPA